MTCYGKEGGTTMFNPLQGSHDERENKVFAVDENAKDLPIMT
jgi:hypothetical protein